MYCMHLFQETEALLFACLPILLVLTLLAAVCFWFFTSCLITNLHQGEFGTNIWHLPTLQLICGPAGPGDRGATTALAWITRTNDSDEGLAFGTENGYLCVWKQSPNKEVSVSNADNLHGWYHKIPVDGDILSTSDRRRRWSGNS